MKSATITKVFNYSVFEKEVIVTREGRTTRTVNMGFDDITGQPIIVRSFDEYDGTNPSTAIDGSITSYTIPAHMKYPSMGIQSWNDMYTVASPSATMSSGTYTITSTGIKNQTNLGDVVMLTKSSGGYVFLSDC